MQPSPAAPLYGTPRKTPSSSAQSRDEPVRIIAGVARRSLRRSRQRDGNSCSRPVCGCRTCGAWLNRVKPARLSRRIERPPLNGEPARGVAFDAMATAALAGAVGLSAARSSGSNRAPAVRWPPRPARRAMPAATDRHARSADNAATASRRRAPSRRPRPSPSQLRDPPIRRPPLAA